MFSNALYVVEPFASIPQVQEYTIRSDALMSHPLPFEMMLKDFINLS